MYMDQIIETKRLILKTWEVHDVDQMSKINADLQVMEYYPKALTKDETAAMIALLSNAKTAKNLA